MLALLQEATAKVATPFDINGGVILWTVGIFLVLLGLLWWKGWPEIIKMVEEREHRIQKQLDEAEKARAEAQALLEEHKKLVAQGKAQAQEILSTAKSAANKEREGLLAKTREEQELMLERARQDISAEKEKAVQALRREAVELSIAAASKLIEKNLTTDSNRKLVSDYLASIEKGK
ncbi:MAG TPA: F0F1 ATP synthase subunit B [Gemmatimonadales bacterium]|jgi:F-type H+-transporting ATPase subunit b|nr:F0F1 ATP synthase subunit B [Gemmatimonadales bacterium]HEX4634346.1 F0F1 ATP synthase subunit B [Gemmatimonadales bacterium]